MTTEEQVRGHLSRTVLQMAQAQANLYAQRRLDAILYGWKPEPLSRRQKVAAGFRECWRRVVLACRALRGDDLHEGCDY